MTTQLLANPDGSCLVTGACGFIGWKVCELLLQAGHAVVGVDNLNGAYDVRLKQWRLAQIGDHPQFTFRKLDVCDRPSLEGMFRDIAQGTAKPAAVINLAARAGVRQSVRDPWAYLETNTTGTVNLLELCREYEVGKFVLSSSSSVYGQENPAPFREDANTDRPLSPYASSKKAAESLCHSYHYLHGLDVTVFRYFTVYGPAGRPDMLLFRLVKWISEGQRVTVYGDGKQSRDFSFVEDIARGTIAGLRPLGYEVINLGSDRPVELLDALGLVEELTGKKAELEFGASNPADVSVTWADIGKARRILDWEPETTFDAGILRVIEWYQSNRSWASTISTD